MSIFNEAIPLSNFKLIDKDGTLLGMFSKEDALALARKTQNDLILIASGVVKIGDMGKYLYEQKQKNKKQKGSTQKRIQLSLNIGDHDLKTKIKHAIEFLKGGDSVQFAILLKRKELQKFSEALEVAKKVLDLISKVGKVDKEPIQNGNQVIMICSKKKNPAVNLMPNTSENTTNEQIHTDLQE